MVPEIALATVIALGPGSAKAAECNRSTNAVVVTQDCNGNGVADACDISNGTSADCNLDDIPDECEMLVDVIPLSHPVLASGDRFGEAVALDGGHLIIGAPGYGLNDDGAVFAYRFEGGLPVFEALWELPFDADIGEQFGAGVAVSGDVAIAASWKDSTLPEAFISSTGTVQVYRHVNGAWSHEQTLFAEDAVAALYFGSAIDIDDSTIVVGAVGDDSAADCTSTNCQSGAVYVFEHDGASWRQTAKLLGSETAYFDHFGTAVAIRGDLLVVGVANADSPEGIDNAGRVYTFNRVEGQWIEQEILAMPEVQEVQDWFGWAVDIDEERIAVGVPGDRLNGVQNGAVVPFSLIEGRWEAETIIRSAQYGPGMFLGNAVALGENRLVAGAVSVSLLDGALENAGAAFGFVRDASGWSQESSFVESPPYSHALLGRSVCTDEDVVVVGVPRESILLSTVYLYPIAPLDCNHDGVPDFCESPLSMTRSSGLFAQCPFAAADLDQDGQVTGLDLAMLLASWGSCASCAADLDGSGSVNGLDLAMLLADWT
jgi:FG-GAP repeat